MSHIRIFDHPFLRSVFDGIPSLAITGTLPNAKPSLAYEGRLTIVNLGQATAEVISVTGALPPGSTVTVDNATDQVVVAWPAYQSSAAPIPNADFEQGDTQWIKGPGWSVVQNDVNDDPSTPTSAWAAKYANQGGNVELRNAVRAAVTAGQSITASCRVQQGASSATNAGAAVRLFFQPASGAAEVMREGNLVDSGSNSEWKSSTLNTTAPVTGTVQIGCRGKRHRQNKPLWVDNFAWNVTQPSVGTNVETTLGPITIRIRDTLGREAEWTGSIVATNDVYVPLGNLFFAGGIHRLVEDYSGPAIQVRRSGTLTDTDIGFVEGSRDIDVAALLAFSLGGDVEVTKIYRQAGAATQNAEWTSSVYPPKIVVAGTYLGYIESTGTHQAFSLSNSGAPAVWPTMAVLLRVGVPGTGAGRYILKKSDSNGGYNFPYYGSLGWMTDDGSNVSMTDRKLDNSASSRVKFAHSSFTNGTVLAALYKGSEGSATAQLRLFVNGVEQGGSVVSFASGIETGSGSFRFGGDAANSPCLIRLEDIAIYLTADADYATATEALQQA